MRYLSSAESKVVAGGLSYTTYAVLGGALFGGAMAFPMAYAAAALPCPTLGFAAHITTAINHFLIAEGAAASITGLVFGYCIGNPMDNITHDAQKLAAVKKPFFLK